MMHGLTHLMAIAAWFAIVVFVFALIGVYATIRWIVGLVTSAERAAEREVETVERAITHRDS
jgi:hypothetical protein